MTNTTEMVGLSFSSNIQLGVNNFEVRTFTVTKITRGEYPVHLIDNKGETYKLGLVYVQHKLGIAYPTMWDVVNA